VTPRELRITDDAVPLHVLTMVQDGTDVIVGRADIDTYAVFPADGAELLRRLRAGVGVTEAGRWYLERYGEPVDMAGFLATLRELEFLRVPGDRVADAGPQRWQRLGQAAFSWPAWSVYGVVVGWALGLLVADQVLRPDHESFFFTPSLLVMELGLLFGQLPGILFHEAMHTLAGRRLGNRLHLLVFETDRNGLWSVPRGRRYLPLLAGLLGDVLWWSVLTILAWLTGTDGFPGAYFLALALATLLRLFWQFYFYPRTDVYFLNVVPLVIVAIMALRRRRKERNAQCPDMSG
jgi:hypothetical protein